MTLEPKASLDKQPDWIDTCAEEISRIELPRMTCKSNIKKLIQKYIPQTSYCSNTQEDTYQKTTVPNVLLYETGYKEWYQKGRDDMLNDCINNYEFILNELWKRYIDREFIVRKVLSPKDTK